jgi:hypothetical protein
MARVVRMGGPVAIGEPMLRAEMPATDIKSIYGSADHDFVKSFRTLDWNVQLLKSLGLDVVAASLHPDGRRMWDDFYRPLLDSNGQSTVPARQEEIDIWHRDAGRYHGIGVILGRQRTI